MDAARARLVAKELQFAHSADGGPLYFHGASMLPLLQEGDEVVVEPVVWDDIAPGDIVTYRFEDKFPTRRVARKSKDRLVVSCDHWPTARFDLRRDDVLGRAVARRRDGAWLRDTDEEWRRARRVALARSRPSVLRRVIRRIDRWLTPAGASPPS